MILARVLLLAAVVCASLLATSARADTVTDPRITLWVTSGSYARVYETASDKSSGNAVTTWPRSGLTNGGGGQATKVYSDVQRVVYSNSYVYVYVTGLPSYTAGNWVTPNNMTYTSWPTNRAAIHRIPRTPTIPTTKQKTNGSGGVLLNGVYVWANGDAQSYNTSTGVVSMQGGQGIWNRLAGVAENFNFDPAKGHQPSSGAYHNHVNPIALRYQLGDNVTYNAATKAYAEAANPTQHSPLLGWANDGLPIYGPYGYSSAMDANSGVRRMTSGFVKRDGQTTNKNTNQPNTNLATTGRTTLPVWAASVQGKSTTLASTEYGPNTTTTYQVGGGVTSTYSIGLFAEDYDYLGDLGYTQGTDFDLNRQNVRYCVTPEFPSGTYAYFVCIDSSGNTVFPDIINQEFFGTPPGSGPSSGQGTVTSITETVTEYARGGQALPISTLTAQASGNNVQLTWPSVEGGTYTVASSPDDVTYATLSTTVASGGTTTTYTTATQAAYYKVTLNAVATYDTNGNGGVTGVNTSTAKTYYAAGATAPSITTQPAAKTVLVGASVTFTVAASGTPTLTYQWLKDGDPIAGATAASYTLAKTTAASAGFYSVVVTNGSGSATSDAAELVVNVPPSITSQPVAQSVAYGDPVSFTVEASGTDPLAYQWRKNNVDLPDETDSTLTIDSAVLADAGNYTVVVTNSYGTTTSSIAKLTVSVPTPAFSIPAEGVPAGPAVSLDLSGGEPVAGVQYFATGLPAGLSLNAATGEITGSVTAPTGTYTITYWAQYGSLKSTVSTVQLLVYAVAPEIATQPADQTVVAGAGATFSVSATGTATLTYQWYKDGKAIPSATTVTYTISKTTAASAGAYSVVVTNQAGTATSADAVLVVNLPPSISTQPASQAVLYSAPVTFAVEAAGTAELAYQWRKNNVDLPGADQSTYQIDTVSYADAGNYTVVVTNPYGTATSSVAKLTVNVPTPTLSLPASVPTTGPVSTSLAGDTPYPGVQYFATGLPAGLSLNTATGEITGVITAKPGVYTIKYWAQFGDLKSAVGTFTFTVATFPAALVGKFEALLALEEGVYTLPNAKVALTVTSTGAFTGTLTCADTKAYPFKGTLALDEDYAGASASVAVARGTGLSPYELVLAVDSDGVFSVSEPTLGATDSGAKLATFAKGVKAPWTGAYTVAITATVGSDVRAPHGNGYATASISSAGVLSMTGKLADGVALTGSSAVTADGRVLWFGKPYKTAGGRFTGELTLSERTDRPGRYSGGGSDFAWKKPAAPKDKLFTGGFGTFQTFVEMQPWDAPTATVNLASQLGVNPAGDTFDVSLDYNFWFSAGDIQAGYVEVPLALSSTGAFTVADTANPASFKIKVTPKTGAFTGSFKIGARSVTFQGVLMQEPQPITLGLTTLGFGYFVLPETQTDPLVTGAVQFFIE